MPFELDPQGLGAKHLYKRLGFCLIRKLPRADVTN